MIAYTISEFQKGISKPCMLLAKLFMPCAAYLDNYFASINHIDQLHFFPPHSCALKSAR